MVSIMELGLSVNAIARGVMWLIQQIYEGVGNYGVAVILFTLILKAAMSPLDVWQKVVMTKNNRAMERMKPQLEKLQKQYGGNKELYSQKQMELYRKEKYSMLGSCLPSIISMVIFFMVFAGFNGMIKQYNAQMYVDMSYAYYDAYDSATGTDAEKTMTAEQAVVEKYETDYKKQTKFLWVRNVFMPDSWKRPIPNYENFIGTGIGKLGIKYDGDISSLEKDGRQVNLTISEYDEKIMKPLIVKYNDYNQDGAQKAWNGLMLLPLIAGFITFASTKLMKQVQPPAMPTANGQGEGMQNAMQTNMKMMQWFMPVMLGVLALLYSTAFTIYMVISNLFSTIFQLVYNLVVKANDKRREEKLQATTFK